MDISYFHRIIYKVSFLSFYFVPPKNTSNFERMFSVAVLLSLFCSYEAMGDDRLFVFRIECPVYIHIFSTVRLFIGRPVNRHTFHLV